jgi:hypothetical protein
MATAEGSNIRISTFAMGSQDAFRSILEGDRRIHVWTPASDMQEDLFIQEWTAKFKKSPILEEQSLALTPLVLLMWEDRYQEFIRKYKTTSLGNFARAMQEKGGWDGIARKPEWGRFKFGVADPNRFNSGLVLLFLLAHEYYRNPGPLTEAQIRDKGLLTVIDAFRKNAVGRKFDSRDLANEMVARGPSSYDVIFTYESVALRSFNEAAGRWGKIRLIYPVYNFWMDNPYYVLNAPWCGSEQQEAARSFLRYLYSPRIQKELLAEKIRPANPEIPLMDPGSPFVQYKQQGVVADIENALDEPRAEIVKAMWDDWEQAP